MRQFKLSALLPALSVMACAHASQAYNFTVPESPKAMDVVLSVLATHGLRPDSVDRQQGNITTQWFDTGYRFREIDDGRNLQYSTNVFLRYRIHLKATRGEETVVLETDVQRCAPRDAVVLSTGVAGSCEPMDFIFPTQQKQIDQLGSELEKALSQQQATSRSVGSPSSLSNLHPTSSHAG